MNRSLIAVVVIALASLTPAVAYAGEDSGHGDGHGGGHDTGMDEHGGSGHHDGNAPTQAGAREIAVKAGHFRFTPNQITLAPGEDVTIVLRSSDTFHDFVVKGEGHIVGAEAKKTAKGGLRIDQPGTYKFWCSVKDHRPAGMKGTIVVQ